MKCHKCGRDMIYAGKRTNKATGKIADIWRCDACQLVLAVQPEA